MKMLKKILICLLIVALLIPMGAAFADDHGAYCDVTFTYMDGENQKSVYKTFDSFEEYKNYHNNTLSSLSDHCIKYEIGICQEDGKVILRQAEEYVITSYYAKQIVLVDSNGNRLSNIRVGKDTTQVLTFDCVQLLGHYVFDIDNECTINFNDFWYKGYGETFKDDIFNLHAGSTVNITDSTFDNMTLEDDTELFDFCDGEATDSLYTSINGFEDVYFSNIKSDDKGIIRMEHKNDSISGITFDKCRSQVQGGAIYSKGGTIKACSFINCSSDEEGGAIYADVNHSKIWIHDCNFESNSSKDQGGAIYIIGDNESGEIKNCEFYNNKADSDGGAIYTELFYLKIKDSNFLRNHSNEDGGAIYINNSYNIYTNCSFTQNVSDVDGGAVCIDDDNAEMYDCSFYDNHAHDDGGAVYVGVGMDDARFERCVFEGNRADDECDNVDGRSDTKMIDCGSTVSGGNVWLIICIVEALAIAALVVIILRKKQEKKAK